MYRRVAVRSVRRTGSERDRAGRVSGESALVEGDAAFVGSGKHHRILGKPTRLRLVPVHAAVGRDQYGCMVGHAGRRMRSEGRKRGNGHDPYGPGYAPEVCVLVYVKLSIDSANCEDAKQLSTPNLPVEAKHGGERLLSGFAPPGTGSVEVTFQQGSAQFPAVGGIYGGSVSAQMGKALSTTNLQTAVPRTSVPVLLVDQTGLYSSFLASRPRMTSVAARIHAQIPSVTAVNLGYSVRGTRAHDSVMYAPGASALAKRVARALHAARPSPLGVGAAKMFGQVAQVVVLVGRSDQHTAGLPPLRGHFDMTPV